MTTVLLLSHTIDQLASALAKIDDRLETLLVERGLTRGALLVHLRRKRRQSGRSLRDVAKAIGCSAAMLSDMESGRRWSDDLVAAYVREVTR